MYTHHHHHYYHEPSSWRNNGGDPIGFRSGSRHGLYAQLISSLLNNFLFFSERSTGNPLKPVSSGLAYTHEPRSQYDERERTCDLFALVGCVNQESNKLTRAKEEGDAEMPSQHDGNKLDVQARMLWNVTVGRRIKRALFPHRWWIDGQGAGRKEPSSSILSPATSVAYGCDRTFSLRPQRRRGRKKKQGKIWSKQKRNGKFWNWADVNRRQNQHGLPWWTRRLHPKECPYPPTDFADKKVIYHRTCSTFTYFRMMSRAGYLRQRTVEAAAKNLSTRRTRERNYKFPVSYFDWVDDKLVFCPSVFSADPCRPLSSLTQMIHCLTPTNHSNARPVPNIFVIQVYTSAVIPWGFLCNVGLVSHVASPSPEMNGQPGTERGWKKQITKKKEEEEEEE